MYRTIPLSWSAPSTTFIAASQNGTTGNPLILNPANLNNNTGRMDLEGFFRFVTLTSANNLSAVNFVISGFDNYGNVITETLAGPNNNTVTSTKSYYTVTSVTPSANATAVSVGTGVQGSTPPLPFNYALRDPSTGTGYQFVSGGTNNVSLFTTRQNVRVPGQNLTVSNIDWATAIALTTSTTAQLTPFSGFYLLVNSGNTSSFKFYVYDNF